MALAPPWKPGVIDEATGNQYNRQQATNRIQSSNNAGAGSGGIASSVASSANAAGPGSAPTGTNSGGLSGMTGWAGQQGFTPELLGDNIYDSPWWLLPYVFQGIDSASPGYQALRDIGGDPMALYNIIYGSNGMIPQESHGDYANFLNQLYSNLGSSGGQAINARQLLSSIFGAGEDSTLGQIMSAGDLSQQSRTLYNLIRDATNMGLNPLAASGYQAATARGLDDYGSAMLTRDAGDTVGPAQYLRQNRPDLMVR